MYDQVMFSAFVDEFTKIANLTQPLLADAKGVARRALTPNAALSKAKALAAQRMATAGMKTPAVGLDRLKAVPTGMFQPRN